MEKPTQEAGMSLNYRINGEVISFKSKGEFADFLKSFASGHQEPLKVESLDRPGRDYDHMEEVLELSYQAIPCIKGLQAIAEQIHTSGSFRENNPDDIIRLSIRCRDLMDELMDIAAAAIPVYESDWGLSKMNREAVTGRVAEKVTQGD